MKKDMYSAILAVILSGAFITASPIENEPEDPHHVPGHHGHPGMITNLYFLLCLLFGV